MAGLASACGAALILGLVRGGPGSSQPTAAAFLAETLARLAGARLLIEPINAQEAAWPNTLAEGLDCLRGLGNPKARLLADTYHLARSGELGALAGASTLIGHIHIAGPLREAPAGQPGLAEALLLARRQGIPVGFELARNAATYAAVCAAWARQVGHENGGHSS